MRKFTLVYPKNNAFFGELNVLTSQTYACSTGEDDWVSGTLCKERSVRPLLTQFGDAPNLPKERQKEGRWSKNQPA